MISAAGRRVALLRILEQSIRHLDITSEVIATDISRLSSAYHAASRSRLVPRYSDSGCLAALIKMCREEQIGLIIPTIDPDLKFYSEYREALSDSGVKVLLSGPETVAIGSDKQATHDWLVDHNLPTVRQMDLKTALASSDSDLYPLFIKPRFGSSSVGTKVIQHPDELQGLPKDVPYIVQSLASGREYTVDVYVDREGRCRCAVPRLRLETRGGEVSKGMSVRVDAVQRLAKQVAETLPGASGVLNVQMFYEHGTNELQIIEVNPRFGGGYPLSDMAGATMAQWVLEDFFALPSTADDGGWKDGVVMLRYDDAVFVSHTDAGLDRYGDPMVRQDDFSELG
jgi:carbamoyl-phosphate synthase large subunit